MFVLLILICLVAQMLDAHHVTIINMTEDVVNIKIETQQMRDCRPQNFERLLGPKTESIETYVFDKHRTAEVLPAKFIIDIGQCCIKAIEIENAYMCLDRGGYGYERFSLNDCTTKNIGKWVTEKAYTIDRDGRLVFHNLPYISMRRAQRINVKIKLPPFVCRDLTFQIIKNKNGQYQIKRLI